MLKGELLMLGVLYHRIAGIAPQGVRMVHHYLQDGGHELAEHLYAVFDLSSVYLAVPWRPSMYQLVSQHVSSAQDNGQDVFGILARQCVIGVSFSLSESLLPGGLVEIAFLPFPEAGEHVPIVQ